MPSSRQTEYEREGERGWGVGGGGRKREKAQELEGNEALAEGGAHRRL
jgi:hypothetical protein